MRSKLSYDTKLKNLAYSRVSRFLMEDAPRLTFKFRYLPVTWIQWCFVLASIAPLNAHASNRCSDIFAPDQKTSNLFSEETRPFSKAVVADRDSNLAVAKKLMRYLNQLSGDLYSTSGYSSPQELNSVLNRYPLMKEAKEALEEGHYDFAINAPPSIRQSFLETGYTNTHQTGQSNTSVGRTTRSRAEAALLGISTIEYDSLPHATKPKYGYILPKEQYGSGAVESDASLYGSDVWILKKDRLRPYTTFTPGDSLKMVTIAHDRFRANLLSYTPHNWSDIFLPINRIELVVPMIANVWLHNERFWQYTSPYRMTKPLHISRRWDAYGIYVPKEVEEKYKPPKFSGTQYIELQFWSPEITLADVQEFRYDATRNPQLPFEFVAKLKAAGVTITPYQRRPE